MLWALVRALNVHTTSMSNEVRTFLTLLRLSEQKAYIPDELPQLPACDVLDALAGTHHALQHLSSLLDITVIDTACCSTTAMPFSLM